MKKQTKLVAVLSTAALLAIGASMTSFSQLLAGQRKTEHGYTTTVTAREQPIPGRNPETTGITWTATVRWQSISSSRTEITTTT